MLIYILCTGMALKGAVRKCGRNREDLESVGLEVLLIAYDKELNGNMY